MPKHEEQNDALKRGIKQAVERYKFAIKCLDKDKRVIDIGCGMGYGCYMMREAGFDVVGIDNNKKAVEYANKNYPGDYIICDIEKDGISGQRARIGVCLEVLCHFKNPQKFIETIDLDELVISAPVDPDPNDGYPYRLHDMSEKDFWDLFVSWELLDILRQNKYIAVHIKKT